MRINDHMKKMIKTLEIFQKLLDQENAAFEAMEFDIIKNLQNKKYVLIKNYSLLSAALPKKIAPEEVVDPKMKEKLLQTYQSFRKSLRTNSHLILAAKKNTERCIEIYRASPELKNKQIIGYNNKGHLNHKTYTPLSYRQIL